ncbi:MAG: MlaD family protein [Treponema sp.]|nr:MlaD family protein [Treponema sp.]
MKFKIKYADQVVGVLSALALAVLIFLVFLIGSKQNWFVKKHQFYTIVKSGSGVSEGMSIQYKGFGIGKVKSITLDDNDLVEVKFFILDDYIDRVKGSSIIELSVSPIGLGSSMIFYPGNGDYIMEDESFIPEKSSAEGQQLIKAKKVNAGASSDSITTMLGEVDLILRLVGDILSGNPDNDIAKLIKDVDQILLNVNDLTAGKNSQIEQLLTNINDILKNIDDLTADTQGLVPRLLETEENKGQIANLMSSLTGTVDSLSSSVDEDVMPQVGNLLVQVETLLKQVQDVMTGLKNNPLIKNGVPDRLEKETATPKLREEDF